MAESIGVAVFGFGRMGQIHTRSLIDGHRARILYIIEEYDDAARKTIQDTTWNLVATHQTQVLKPSQAEKALQDNQLKAVFVCHPTRFHESVIELVCKYKKDIFCEKPISVTVEGTLKSYAAAKQAGVTLMCALNRRFDPAFVKLQKKVAAGEIGKLQLINAIGRDPPALMGNYDSTGYGTMFVDMGIHFFDMVSWMAGEYAEQVSAMGHAHFDDTKKRNDYDVVAWMLKFPSGLIAYVDGCRHTPYGYDQRVEAIGVKGALVAENQRDDELILRTQEGDLINPIHPLFLERYQKSYTAEVNHFLDVLEGKTTCSVSSESVIYAMKAAMAAEESVKTKKVVDIK